GVVIVLVTDTYLGTPTRQGDGDAGTLCWRLVAVQHGDIKATGGRRRNRKLEGGRGWLVGSDCDGNRLSWHIVAFWHTRDRDRVISQREAGEIDAAVAIVIAGGFACSEGDTGPTERGAIFIGHIHHEITGLGSKRHLE